MSSNIYRLIFAGLNSHPLPKTLAYSSLVIIITIVIIMMVVQLYGLDILLLMLLVGSIAYLGKRTYWKEGKQSDNAYPTTLDPGRRILDIIPAKGKNCVIFYGSQTGTAENFASRLAKEGAERFGLRTMIADLDDYDYDDLIRWDTDIVVFFILATYGEGEPTDNAVRFYDTISAFPIDDSLLSSLRYAGFGLGNDTYEHYNAMIRNVDTALAKRGAVRVGKIGEGNDGAGTMEDDFLAWKEEAWTALSVAFSLKERKILYEPSFSVMESPPSIQSDVFLGELGPTHVKASRSGPFSPQNPYIAKIVESRELFNIESRNCLHMEIDIEGSGMTYETGDHVAIWPANPSGEVDRILKVFGLEEKRNHVIDIKSLDATANVRMPSRTTYDAAFRYYLEICAPVSRQFLSNLAKFAPNCSSKAELARLATEKEYFRERISRYKYNLGQTIQISTPDIFMDTPFSLLLEGLGRMQPRYYSISSSGHVQPNRISITTAVESYSIQGSSHMFKGVATNYLLMLKRAQNNESSLDQLNYDICGPRSLYAEYKIPIHIRHSNFKLPADVSRPIIMVGPGTGVAPFRGFLHERAALASQGETVGPCVLFYGCRNRCEDFIYKDEWEVRSSGIPHYRLMSLKIA